MRHSSPKEHSRYHAHPVTKTLAAVGVGTSIFHAVRFGMALFGPTRPYRLQPNSDVTPESEDFLYRLACLTDAIMHRQTQISVLRNGAEFYPAQFKAIDAASRTINLEAYEFLEGNLTRELLTRLTRKAREGVEVRLVIDAIGSFSTGQSYFKSLTDAGGKVAFFHRLDLKDITSFNHRTHRKLLIVDGAIGFIGGADYADEWIEYTKGKPPWRDTVLKVEGAAAATLTRRSLKGGSTPPANCCSPTANSLSKAHTEKPRVWLLRARRALTQLERECYFKPSSTRPRSRSKLPAPISFPTEVHATR